MRILLSGPPSSGKSTQGRRIAALLGVPHVSSGDLIRAAAASGDPRDVEVLRLVSDGSLAPSGAIAHMVGRRLDQPDCASGFVLDGFPRRHIEAAYIAASQPIDALIVLEAPPETLMERVRLRAGAGRADDDPAHFPTRIRAYETETRGAHAELVHHGIPVFRVDAAAGPEATGARMDAVLAVLAPRSEPARQYA